MTILDTMSFSERLEPHRREIHLHCYRMMGTVQDAEDIVQETFLKAWHKRHTYAGRASLRAWLYKIATNACLDTLKKASRRTLPVAYEAVSSAESPISPDRREPIWLQPYPDEFLPNHQIDPSQLVSEREDVSLAFMTMLHLLPPRQRAILILRDVLNLKASEVAILLDSTVSGVKSALHRARKTLNENKIPLQKRDSIQWNGRLQTQLDNYVHAWEHADIDALVGLLTEEATFSMPPIPSWYQGRAEIQHLLQNLMLAGDAVGRWRLLPTRANGQPAYGFYTLSHDGSLYLPYGIQVLTIKNGQIDDIITFREPELVAHFSLPNQLAV